MPDDGYLSVYCIHDKYIYIRKPRCVLRLPSIHHKGLRHSVRLCTHTVTGIGPHDARYPFSSSRQRALIAVSMDVPCPTETMVLAETIIIFIPVMTIYSILNRTDAYRCPNTALDLAWDEWGVKGTRVIKTRRHFRCVHSISTKAWLPTVDRVLSLLQVGTTPRL